MPDEIKEEPADEEINRQLLKQIEEKYGPAKGDVRKSALFQAMQKEGIQWQGTRHEEHQKFATRDRFVVNETVSHHYVDGSEPVIAHTRYNRFIESGEQPYVRHTKAKQVPEPLDYGWLKQPAHVVIQNTEGKGIQTYLTPDREKLLANKSIILSHPLVGINTPIIRVRPGESCRFEPCGPLCVSCESGEVSYTLTALPS